MRSRDTSLAGEGGLVGTRLAHTSSLALCQWV